MKNTTTVWRPIQIHFILLEDEVFPRAVIVTLGFPDFKSIHPSIHQRPKLGNEMTTSVRFFNLESVVIIPSHPNKHVNDGKRLWNCPWPDVEDYDSQWSEIEIYDKTSVGGRRACLEHSHGREWTCRLFSNKLFTNSTLSRTYVLYKR